MERLGTTPFGFNSKSCRAQLLILEQLQSLFDELKLLFASYTAPLAQVDCNALLQFEPVRPSYDELKGTLDLPFHVGPMVQDNEH